MNITKKIPIVESHLLLPLMWEGDLELHTNREKMSKSRFKDAILHGDTVLSIAIQLVLEEGRGWVDISSFSASYRKSVSVGDELYIVYHPRNSDSHRKQIDFEAINQRDELILSGSFSVTGGWTIEKLYQS